MAELGTITVKILILYLVIIIIFRLMGKREVGELGIVDLVVSVMIAEMAVVVIQSHINTIVEGIFSIVLVTVIQITSAYLSLKSRRFRRVVDGEPTIIIRDGKILEKEMKKQRYNFDDLLMQLREKDIRDIADVEFAILEPTGKLSVLEKEKNKSGLTVPLILDGEIQYEKLKELNKDTEWLFKELRKKGIQDYKEVSLCSLSKNKLFIDLYDK